MIALKKQDLLTKLTSTSLVDVYPTYSTTTTYSVGDKVSHVGRTWKSTADNNLDNEPVVGSLAWFDENPTNSTAWADNFPTTVSEKDGDIVLVFENMSPFLYIAAANMYGEELKIKVEEVDGVTLLDKTIDIFEEFNPADHADYWSVFTEPKRKKNHLEVINFFNIGTKVTVTITAKDGKASLGFLAIGVGADLGCTYAELTVSRDGDLEVLEKSNGEKVIIGGKGWRTSKYKLSFHSLNRLRDAEDLLDELLGSTTAFIGSQEDESYNSLGFYQSWEMNVPEKHVTFTVYSSDKY